MRGFSVNFPDGSFVAPSMAGLAWMLFNTRDKNAAHNTTTKRQVYDFHRPTADAIQRRIYLGFF